MKKALSLLLMLAAFGIVFAGPASALMYSYTDTTTKDGFNIEYILDISEGITSDYDAVLTINSSSTSTDDWYAGAFNFKFFEGSVPTELDPFSYSGSTGLWSVADKDTNSGASIGGWSSLTQAGRAGFYLTDLESPFTLADVADGVYVSGVNTAAFEFSFSGQGNLNELYIPFQVAYWDGFAGSSANIKFGQLSEALSVYEPATMLFLGCGLIGLAGIGRKKFKN
jgi:hypothetical protein